MKILLIGLKLSIGNQLMMETLAGALQRQGHIVAGLGDRRYPAVHTSAFHPMTDGRSYQRMVLETLNVPLWYQIAQRIRRERPDVCYLISSHSLNAPLLGLLRREWERPLLVSHVHDPAPHGGTPVALWIVLSQWLQVRLSDRVAVYGERLKADCARHNRYPPERIVVIPHGAYRPVRAAPPDPAAPRWFSLVGRIERYKGIDVFVEAARFVLRSRPDARFLIGGGGDLAPYRRQLERLGGSLVVENRLLSDGEIDRIAQRSWATVLPYRDGTQSGVIPVAYYNACPAIVSDVGSLPELVTPETGTVVPPGDAASLATAMLEWMDGSKRQQAGQAAFAFYREHLIWDQILQEHLPRLFEPIRGGKP